MNLGSIFYPRYIAAERILQYVRGKEASRSSSIETLLKILNNQAEALEFGVTQPERGHRCAADAAKTA